MKKYKNFLFYLFTFVFFLSIIYFIENKGKLLEYRDIKLISERSLSDRVLLEETLWYNMTEPLSVLLIQIFSIIIIARIFGFLCKKIGQPSVIGEIVAGIFLGPSFIGMYFPEFSAFLFPTNSLGNLQFLSQIGLILFMFVIGMELDLSVLKNKAQEAVIISHTSIIFPFTLGIILAYFLYSDFASSQVEFLSFSLFIGISMSITAFPVLARIVQEKGLSKTRLGSIVITSAAADDITAWCLLAVVIAIVKASSIMSAFYTVLMAFVYVILMIKLVQPFFKKIGEKHYDKESINRPIIAIFIITLFISSYLTEIIGIHALFGAFMTGVIMPPKINFRSVFIEKVEDVSLVLLLPLFFVYTGLRTQIGLLNTWDLWITCFIIIGVAILGKFIGSALSARFVGQSWKDSLSIGALMNTRGLMELIVLNIGYDLGVLHAEIFAMFVIMALFTTFMTGPSLDFINKFFRHKKLDYFNSSLSNKVQNNILVSFSSSEKGLELLCLVDAMIAKSKKNSHITMLHLSPDDLNTYSIKGYEAKIFKPIEEHAQKNNISITKVFKSSLQVDTDISKVASTHQFNLLLMSMGNSIFKGSLLGKILGFTNKIINPERLVESISKKNIQSDIFGEVIGGVLKEVKIPVGIYLNKNNRKFDKIFFPILSIGDDSLIIYAQKFMEENDSSVSIWSMNDLNENHAELYDRINYFNKDLKDKLSVYEEEISKDFLRSQDLVLISLDSWKKLISLRTTWLSEMPSVLIIKESINKK